MANCNYCRYDYKCYHFLKNWKSNCKMYKKKWYK